MINLSTRIHYMKIRLPKKKGMLLIRMSDLLATIVYIQKKSILDIIASIPSEVLNKSRNKDY